MSIPLYVVLGAGQEQFFILEGVSRPQGVVYMRFLHLDFRELYLGDMASTNFGSF